MQDKLPVDIVRVGPFWFPIKEYPLSWKKSYGYFDTEYGEIGIREDRPRQMKAQTLMHEIMHAIWWVYVVENATGEEERVGIIATALIQFYKDNPDMVRYISES